MAELDEAREFVRSTNDHLGPHITGERSDALYQSIVPRMPKEFDFLAGRIALTVDEAAPALGISVRSLQTAIKNGDIPSMKLGGRRLLPLRALERHLEALAYTESGVLDTWETAMARAAQTRLMRARRGAYQARREQKRRVKELRRRAADMKDSPAATRAAATKIVAEMASIQTKFAIEERLASDMHRGMAGDMEVLKREFHLTDAEVLDGPVME